MQAQANDLQAQSTLAQVHLKIAVDDGDADDVGDTMMMVMVWMTLTMMLVMRYDDENGGGEEEEHDQPTAAFTIIHAEHHSYNAADLTTTKG